MMDIALNLTWPDAVNGAFELLGGFAIILSIFKLHQDKKVRGVSWAHVFSAPSGASGTSSSIPILISG